MSIIWTKKKNEIIKETPFCGKYNGDYAACLQNTVNFLVS